MLSYLKINAPSIYGSGLYFFKYLDSNKKEDQEKFFNILKEYKIINEEGKYAHKVSYYFDDNEEDDTPGTTTTLYIGDLVDGYYYVYSLMFDVIAAIPQDIYKWIDWDLIKYVESGIFSMFINDVATIEVNAGGEKVKFDISYVNEGKGDDLTVLCNGKKIDTKNFRQYYMALLYIQNGGYASMEDAEGLDPSATIKVTTAKGVEREYVFYDIATRKSYYTIDGKGEFYVSRDYIKKLASDTVKVQKNEPVIGDEF